MKLPTAPPGRPARVLLRAYFSKRLLAATLGLLTIALYWPVVLHGFVNFDDDVYVTANPQVQGGLTLENFRWAFTHCVSGNWHPVTMLSHMLDCQLYGLNPWGHHLTSLLLHAADTILLFILLQRLTGMLWRSAWIAAVFAFHPLHVESVAWIAERKDVLSTFFGFLTLLTYARYVQKTRSDSSVFEPKASSIHFLRSYDYWLACVFFALGLMSKPMLVTWPFVLLLLDFWPLGRFQSSSFRVLILEKIPLFILTVAAAGTTVLVQKMEGALQPFGNLPFAMRCENALISYVRYISKLFWPVDLAVFYPYPKYWPLLWVVGASLLLAGLSAMIWLKRRNYPFLLTGWFWFVGTLVPVIGLIQVGAQSMADRYSYIPFTGLFLALAWGACTFTRHWRQQKLILPAVAVSSVLLCLGITRHQIGYWKASETLFQHAIAVTRDNFIAHNNLAAAYLSQGQTNAAVGEFKETVRANPDYLEGHIYLGRVLDVLGQTNEALTELQTAVDIKPSNIEAQYNLGKHYFKVGQIEAGVSQFKKAVQFQSGDPESAGALITLLLNQGQTNAAINAYQEAIKATPLNADLHFQLGTVLLYQGQMEEAIAEFQQVIRLKPGSFEAHSSLASLLAKTDAIDQAIGEFQETTRLQPDSAEAHYNLGSLYLKKGRPDDAIGEFQTAVRLAPDFALAHYYLGTIFIRKNQLAAAINELQTAIRLNPDNAQAHNKLGIAFGGTGHLPEGIAEFQEALRRKPDYAEAGTNLAIALKFQATGGH